MAVIHRYVDPVLGSDANGGTNMTNDAKKTLGGALALITDVIDGYIIHLKPSTTAYTGDCILYGVHAVGEEAMLRIQPWDDGGANVNWNDDSYWGGVYSPFEGTQTGTFNQALDDFPVVLNLKLTIWNSARIELLGLAWATTAGVCQAGVEVRGLSEACFRYCRFSGAGARLTATLGALISTENGHFVDNDIAIYGSYGAKVGLHGNNYIEDPGKHGLVLVGADGAVLPWEEHSSFYTTEIKTTTPRSGPYAAVRLAQGAMLSCRDQHDDPDSAAFGHLKVLHDHHSLSERYFGVLLEQKSMVVGASCMSFVTRNADGDYVPMPEKQNIMQTEGEDTTVID